jgi:UDP-glucuronate 4-epimerase
MKVLLTGAAGFIGFHVAKRLLERGDAVHGADDVSDYYDVSLKRARLEELAKHSNFSFSEFDIADAEKLKAVAKDTAAETVIHFAAQAGVRYSITNPESYVSANLVGFANVLEACRAAPPKHLLYASSSSVYGANASLPFRETDPTDQPVNLYAATKRANEGMAYAYSHLFKLPATGLRFFTVYGEWGRPDMAYFSFAEKIMAGKPIDIYRHGDVARDFTYVGDAADAVLRLISVPSSEPTPHRVVNIASGTKTRLLDFIAALEASLGMRAVRNFVEAHPGDMIETWADVSRLRELAGEVPSTSVARGIELFARWYSTWRARRDATSPIRG